MICKAIIRFFLLCFIPLYSTISYAAEVTLAWNASLGGAQGYRIYYGTVEGVYTSSVDVGNVTRYTLSGLQTDVTYFFVTRAYNDEGESGNSNEVQWIYDTDDTTPPVVSISGPASSTEPVINLSGTASDNNGVNKVTWVSDRGGSGNAQGTINWTISGITLSKGQNIITVSAEDIVGNIGSAQTYITYTYTPLGDTIQAEFGNAANSDYPNTIEDTFLGGNVNHSTLNDRIEIYTWPANTNANAILIKWDLNQLPSNATIQSAMLNLYMNGYEGTTGGDDLYEISTHKIINYDPVISLCTWETYDGVNSWTGGADGGQSDTAPAEDVQMVDKTLGYKQWNVTQMVKDWLAAPASNFGMMLLSDQGANKANVDTNRIFVPAENADANKRPKLIVTYTLPDLNPAPAAPTGIRVLTLQ